MNTISRGGKLLEEFGYRWLLFQEEVGGCDGLSRALIEVLGHAGVSFVDVNAEDRLGDEV
jgi:hypothetical protein